MKTIPSIKVANQTIDVYGKKEEAVIAVEKLKTLPLTGNESKDRLVIQEQMKDVPAFKKRNILYAGNSVWPYEPIVKEFKKLKNSGRLNNMSNMFYEFLHLNFDIAHYDKNGYAYYYHDSFNELWNTMLCKALKKSIPCWKTDVQRIADGILFIMEGK